MQQCSSVITAIPAPDASFDAILCSEVLEHVPEPTHALDEFARLLKPGGKLILTAPFASLVHMAPYHYCSGFSRYWYKHHLSLRGFEIVELPPTTTGSPTPSRNLHGWAAWNASAATGAGRSPTRTACWACSISNFVATSGRKTWPVLAGIVWR